MEIEEAYITIKGELGKLKTAVAKAKDIVKKHTKVINKVAIIVFRVSTRTLKAGLRKVTAMIRNVGRRMASIVKWAALAIAGVIGASVKAYASFEEQLANISTMLDEQTMRLMPRYGKELKRLAIKFGEATETLSEGLYSVLSASIKADKAIGVLEIAARAAAAGITDTGTAVKAIVSILNAYGMSADKAGKVSDILFAAVKKGQTTFAELAASVGQATAIAASAGVSFEEVAAGLATITRGGISTAEAVTALRMAIISLQGKNKGAVKIAKAYGVELSVTALKAEGLVGMVKKLSKLSPTVLASIFSEVRARVALNVLIKDQTGFLGDYETTMKSAGMTAKAYNKQTGLLTLSTKRLWQAIKITGTIIGEAFAPQVKKANNALREWLVEQQPNIEKWSRRFADAVKHIKSVLKDFVGYLSRDFQGAINTATKLILHTLIAIAKAVKVVFKKLAGDALLVMTGIFHTLAAELLKSDNYFARSLSSIFSIMASASIKSAGELLSTWKNVGEELKVIVGDYKKNVSGLLPTFGALSGVGAKAPISATQRYGMLKQAMPQMAGTKAGTVMSKEAVQILRDLRKQGMTTVEIWRRMERSNAVGEM